MTGKLYELLHEHDEAVRLHLEDVRSGESELAEKDTTKLLIEIIDQEAKVVPEAIEYLKGVLDDDDATIHKLHIDLEDCERFLKGVEFAKLLAKESVGVVHG